MIGRLYLWTHASLRSTNMFLQRVVAHLKNGVGFSSSLGRVRFIYRERPFPVKQGVTNFHPGLLNTFGPRQREGCFFLQDKEISHTNDIRGRYDDVIYLFPAGATVERLTCAANHSVLNFVGELTINSAQKLSVKDFEEVLRNITRKIQSLRVCLRYFNNELWVCELRKPKLDFKVVAGKPETEMMRLVTSRFDLENGPLWRARLMPCGPADPYPVPHIKNQFPHQYILIFSFCHSTADGMITLMVFSLIMKFLQDFMKGVPIDDGQLGKIVSHSHSEQIEKMLMEDLKKDPERFDTLQRDLADKQFKSLLDEAFGVPEVTHPTVESIHTVMDKSTVDKFMRKCRNVGITFNSGFTCVINTALVELVQEAGVVRDMYRVTSRHVIDERRYWGGDPFKDFGCHVGAMSHSMVTPHNIRQNFWEYAKVFGKEFREKLRGNYHFFERILKARSLPKDFTYDSYYATPPPLLYDYLISYMYNSNFSRIGLYDHLHLTDFRSYVLIHNCEYSNQHTILTLHDTFYEFTYSTGRMTQETAQKFHDKVLTVLNDLANI